MAVLDLTALNQLPKVERVMALADINNKLDTLSAEDRVIWGWRIYQARRY